MEDKKGKGEAGLIFKNYSIGVFYIILAVILIFIAFSTMDFYLTINQVFPKLIEVAQCEIKYQDFYYKGLCQNQKEILSFVYNISKGVAYG